MKQGNILNRIVMLVLFAGVVLYLGVSAWRGVTAHISTVISYAYTLDDTVEATGFLVRDEYVLPGESRLADVLPAEGEKVAVGETVAYLYGDAAALSRKQEVRALSQQREQLAYALGHSEDHGDNAKLTEDIMSGLVSLRTSVANRDFTGLEDEALVLKNAVYKRDFAYTGGDPSGTQAAVDALDGRLETLKTAAAQDTTAVYSDRSGVFSGQVDGYEALLTPAGLADLTPAVLERLAKNPPGPPAGAIGKLITDSRWQFVCTVSEQDAKRLAEGWQVKVRFSRDWSGEISMRVEHISAPENGQVAVVFSTTRALAQTTLLRRQTVEIVFASRSGIRVPKNALYQDEAGAWGVYGLVGAQAEFKPVTIVGDDEDYYLVEPITPATDLNHNLAKKALRPGDEI
ncbi:MAG: HlyD family efflux transporter periplasmic adaptor subunit, partial [Pseudoflavonifractor sp.]